MVARARRRNDACAEVPGERDGEAGDAARAALDEDRFAALELQRLLERDDCGETRERDRRGLHVAQALWLVRDDRLADRDLLGVGPFARHLADAEHGIARLEEAGAADDDAGEIPAGHVRKGDRSAVLAA